MQEVRARPLVGELRSHTLQAIRAHTPQLERSLYPAATEAQALHGPQWETPHDTAKIPHATTKTWGSQMNKWINSLFF